MSLLAHAVNRIKPSIFISLSWLAYYSNWKLRYFRIYPLFYPVSYSIAIAYNNLNPYPERNSGEPGEQQGREEITGSNEGRR